MAHLRRTVAAAFAVMVAVTVAVPAWSLAAAAAPTGSSPPAARALPVVTFDRHATVRAAGAGAVVSLHVACPGFHVSSLEIGVVQDRADGTQTSASGFAILGRPCTAVSQHVLAPLLTGAVGENSSFPGTGQPLHARSASAVAFVSYCPGSPCIEHYYPAQTVRLADSPDLDRPTDGRQTLLPVALLAPGGGSATLTETTTCTAGVPDETESTALFQRVAPQHVVAAYPVRAPVIRCRGGQATWTERDVAVERSLRAGRAFVSTQFVWGEVRLT